MIRLQVQGAEAVPLRVEGVAPVTEDHITEKPPRGVNFRDYDGVCVASYTVAEARTLTALPEGPKHTGLVFDGWNWTLDEVRALTRPMDIGAMYRTDDGSTRLYLTISNPLRREIGLRSQVNDGNLVIDWGDGTGDTVAPINVAISHTYPGVGDYVLRLIPAAGATINLGFRNAAVRGVIHEYNDGPNANMLRRVELGESVVRINPRAFWFCHALESVTVPASVASIGNLAFSCRRLRALVLPPGITATVMSFNDEQWFEHIMLPPGISESPGLEGAASSSGVTLPDGLTALGTLKNCTGLTELYVPASISGIAAETFSGCRGMRAYHFLRETPPTLANVNAFEGIHSACVIYVPRGALAAYQGATNWSAYADYMQEEPI